MTAQLCTCFSGCSAQAAGSKVTPDETSAPLETEPGSGLRFVAMAVHLLHVETFYQKCGGGEHGYLFMKSNFKGNSELVVNKSGSYFKDLTNCLLIFFHSHIFMMKII